MYVLMHAVHTCMFLCLFSCSSLSREFKTPATGGPAPERCYLLLCGDESSVISNTVSTSFVCCYCFVKDDLKCFEKHLK